MKKLMACMILAGSLAACNSPGERAVGGGLIGAGSGALIGGLATGNSSGALAGAAIGGAGGAIIGAATAPQYRRGYYRERYCRSYDDFGNPIRVPC
ncbi:MAG: hypothetical protein HEQ16_09490 [Bosea sp.]|jgi:osmotically inducible lipoprotein OsmB|nr:hypothetical protein [Bosea sp. (in: a-proteobacteria)]